MVLGIAYTQAMQLFSLTHEATPTLIRPFFDQITEFLHRSHHPGRYDITGDSFAVVAEYETSGFGALQGKMECHRLWADVHVPLNDPEEIHVGCEPYVTPTPYDTDRDVFFTYNTGDRVVVPAGSALLLMPGEPHEPGYLVRHPAHLHKVVFKIRLDSVSSK